MPIADDWKKRAGEYRKLARVAKNAKERSKFRKLAEIYRLWASEDDKRSAGATVLRA